MTSPVQNSGFNTISTGSGNDVVVIRKAEGADGLAGKYEVIINNTSRLMTEDELRNTKFDLGAGQDTLVVSSEVMVGITADGGDNADVMMGGGGDDVFDGGQGGDVIFGFEGDDTLKGGRDRKGDVMDGGRGQNVLYPDAGDVIARGRNDSVITPQVEDAMKKLADGLQKIIRNL